MQTLPTCALVLAGVAAVAAACVAREREPGRDGPPSDDRGYDGPPVAVEVLQMESYPVQWGAIARVTVPTGGHRFTLDEHRHEDGRLDLRATLERPGRDEMVTQALEELSVRHGTGARPIARLRVFVRLTRRGDPSATTPWRLAATSSP